MSACIPESVAVIIFCCFTLQYIVAEIHNIMPHTQMLKQKRELTVRAAISSKNISA